MTSSGNLKHHRRHRIYRFMLQILHSILRNLSSSADKQLEYLTASGVQNSIDEIALEFDDIVGLFVADIKLPEAVRNKLRSIDEQLNKMSNHEDLWTPNALKSRQEWAEIRSIARHALDDLSLVPTRRVGTREYIP